MNVTKKILCVEALMVGLFAVSAVQAADSDAEALMRKSGCFKCHAVDKEKTGTPYKKVAAKYKGDAKAKEKLYVHLTTGPLVEVDGEKEEHKGLKTTNDADVYKVIDWVLSQ